MSTKSNNYQYNNILSDSLQFLTVLCFNILYQFLKSDTWVSVCSQNSSYFELWFFLLPCFKTIFQFAWQNFDFPLGLLHLSRLRDQHFLLLCQKTTQLCTLLINFFNLPRTLLSKVLALSSESIVLALHQIKWTHHIHSLPILLILVFIGLIIELVSLMRYLSFKLSNLASHLLLSAWLNWKLLTKIRNSLLCLLWIVF